MSRDLSALIADAVPEDLDGPDLDAIETRFAGRRRRRRLASAGIAAGLLAAIMVAVTSIPDTPPRIDPVAPTPTPTEDTTDRDDDAAPGIRLPEVDDRPAVEALAWDLSPAVHDPAADVALAARLGLSTVRLHALDGEVVATYAGERVGRSWASYRPVGEAVSQETLTRPLDPGPAVVDGRAAQSAYSDGGVISAHWWTDVDGDAFVRGYLPLRGAGRSAPALVMGPDEHGTPVWLVLEDDGRLLLGGPVGKVVLDGLEGVIRQVVTGGSLFIDNGYGSLGEDGVMVLTTGTSGTDTVSMFGPSDHAVPHDLLVVEPPERVVDVGAVGDVAVVVLRTADGAFDLLVQPLDGSPGHRARTPFGRTVDATPVAAQTSWGLYGPVVTLDVETREGRTSWIVDGPELLYLGREDPTFTPTGLGGQLHLHPSMWLSSSIHDELTSTTCNSREDLNADVTDGPDLVLWYACWEKPTADSGTHLLVPVSRHGPRQDAPSALGLRSLLRRSFTISGFEEFRGLRSSGDEMVQVDIGISSTTIDDDGVTVDLAGPDRTPPEIDRIAGDRFVTALAGTVFQFDEFRSLRITLNGDCQTLADLIGAPSCTFTEADAPWNQ